MHTQGKLLAVIMADNDQDRMEAKAWMADATPADIARIWDCIQRPYSDPAMEVMSRFAQLVLGELVVEKYGPKTSTEAMEQDAVRKLVEAVETYRDSWGSRHEEEAYRKMVAALEPFKGMES